MLALDKYQSYTIKLIGCGVLCCKEDPTTKESTGSNGHMRDDDVDRHEEDAAHKACAF